MPPETKRANVLGLPVDALSLEEACSCLMNFLQNRKTECPEIFHVVTMNAEMAIQALEDADLGDIIKRASLVTPDGIGVVWAIARQQSGPRVVKVAGVDLVQALVARIAQTGHRLYLLGGKPGVAEAAAVALQQRYSGLQITGCHHGFFSPEDEPDLLDKIKAARPDILLVALGVPRQEKWIERHRNELQATIAIGVGGSLDVFAGRVRRAPATFQRLHLEWLYRLIQEPWRMKRMRSTLPPFVYRVLTQNSNTQRVEEKP
ncbi:MAG: WecB/TagA/CpsF family glycosyltransferase [Candidatus Sericytochromatia bacterium]|nr:WecB/TagA/CpsF family glycosyltransferase [Candidatus Sericytochromatia bacterium]